MSIRSYQAPLPIHPDDRRPRTPDPIVPVPQVVMKRGVRAMFVSAYVLIGVLAFGAVVAVAAQFKAGFPRHTHTLKRETHSCVRVGCAKLGDHVSYVLDGTVSQVSSPQAGVVCVQVGARDHAGDFCALSR